MMEILNHLHDRVLLCDGGMGSQVQGMQLTVDKDFRGTRTAPTSWCCRDPTWCGKSTRGYFAAGADMVETNTFGANPMTLGEFGISPTGLRDQQAGGRDGPRGGRAVSLMAGTRFVLGSIGPGTKLPSLGHVDYDTLETALRRPGQRADRRRRRRHSDRDLPGPAADQGGGQCGARWPAARRRTATPIFVQVTVETTGTLLVGADIAAAATVIHALDVPLMGINCATGPQEMAEHVRWLSANWPGLISVQPNAGLPELVDGRDLIIRCDRKNCRCGRSASSRTTRSI